MFAAFWLLVRRCRRESSNEVLLQGAAEGGGRAGHLLVVGEPLPQGLAARKADRVRHSTDRVGAALYHTRYQGSRYTWR